MSLLDSNGMAKIIIIRETHDNSMTCLACSQLLAAYFLMLRWDLPCVWRGSKAKGQHLDGGVD